MASDHMFLVPPSSLSLTHSFIIIKEGLGRTEALDDFVVLILVPVGWDKGFRIQVLGIYC